MGAAVNLQNLPQISTTTTALSGLLPTTSSQGGLPAIGTHATPSKIKAGGAVRGSSGVKVATQGVGYPQEGGSTAQRRPIKYDEVQTEILKMKIG